MAAPNGPDAACRKVDRGDLNQAGVLVEFSESPENQTNVIGSIENGVFLPDYQFV